MKNNNFEIKNSIITQSDAVIHFIQNLDIDMIDALLDEKNTYQDFKKKLFIQKFWVAFDEFINAGDTQLMINNGFCSQFICNNQCSGYRFNSKESGLYFDLIIDIEDGVVKDIYECSSFLCLAADLNTKKRVLIDRNNYIFNLDYPKKDI